MFPKFVSSRLLIVRGSILAGLFLTGLLILQPGCAANEPPARYKDGLRSALSTFLAQSPFEPDPATRYSVANIRASGLTVVLLTGGGWCGSGGCTLLIFRSGGTALKLIGRITLAETPITLMRSSHHGLPDIGVETKDMPHPDHEDILQFDGTKYIRHSAPVKSEREQMPIRTLVDANATAFSPYQR